MMYIDVIHIDMNKTISGSDFYYEEKETKCCDRQIDNGGCGNENLETLSSEVKYE